MAYSRSYRITNKQDFQAVFAQSIKATHKYLQALFFHSERPHARLGISIAKHKIPRAVDRNRLRRVIRESFRHHVAELQGLDIVVLVQAAGVSVNKKQLRIDVDHLWQAIQKKR